MEPWQEPSAYVMISEARKHLAKDGIGNLLAKKLVYGKRDYGQLSPQKSTIPRCFVFPGAR